jgi:DNA end-binding protein Ku
MAAIVWKGYISFGLVSFPVRLFSAGRAEGVHFHLLHRKDLSRVKEVWYCAQENKPIERADIVKGYEVSQGEYVVVEDEELKKIAPATETTMEILQFVHDSEVDPIYFESSYYVAPGEDLTKPYVVFAKAMKESSYSAIAKISMHGREHIVLIRSAEDGLVLHTLFYPDELHQGNKQSAPAKTTATAKEVALATQLIKQLAAPFKPSEFHDTYRENVEKLIEQKQKGQKITIQPKAKRAPVIDLMEALKKSLKSSAASAKKTKASGRSKAA